ncbi:MAG: alanine racemase [Actinomycetota bacterium]|nr:alanine racemase [Actinomycetota bacterium]
MTAPQRWAWADVDLDAIASNVASVRDLVAPSQVWAVVKANGYGHGAVPVATAAMLGGAHGLAVALAGEGVELRRAGIDAPVLVLSEQPDDSAAALVEHRLIPTVYSRGGVDALVGAGAAGLDVHVKVDTGMQRVGVQPESLADVVAAVRDVAPALRLGGVFTHLPIADEPDDPFTADQLRRFDELRTGLDLDDDVLVHSANSAGALAHPAARHDLVRLGIAMYGIAPSAELAEQTAALTTPALSLRSRVSFVKRVAVGSRISYGLRHRFDRPTTVATLPIGYADGVQRRRYEVGGSVLIGGRRRPIVGVVTMDQLMVSCGDDDVALGDEAVLIGRQGDEHITAEEWGASLGTIGYEIVCGIGARVPRVYHRNPE